jgi:CDGSH-type Zn-finger protein
MAIKNEPGTKATKCRIKVVRDGPYLVNCGLPLAKEIVVSDNEGTPIGWRQGAAYPVQETYSLCRCGQSRNHPFCDGTHAKAGFDGTETADRRLYMAQAETITGPGLILTDAEKFCAVGLFCHRAGDAWSLTERSGDEELKQTAIQEACDCPSGRLVAWDKETGKPIEPCFQPSIGLIEDPFRKASGPLWIKGGVPVESADGATYEIRNRITLCRCGKSKNKPFCDGSHCAAGFKDGDPSLE